jgi:hypothetical protein
MSQSTLMIRMACCKTANLNTVVIKRNGGEFNVEARTAFFRVPTSSIVRMLSQALRVDTAPFPYAIFIFL